MANIDTSKIEGYESMSAEEKLKALEGYDFPDADYSGYVKKDVFDKTASELAAKKKELNDHLSEEEKKAREREESDKELRANYEKLLHETSVSKAAAKYLALGYDEKLAQDTAEAFVSGDTDKVFANLQKAQEARDKKVRAEALKDTPKPTPDGKNQVMTLKDFRGLSPEERLKYSEEHPTEYKAMYEGGK